MERQRGEDAKESTTCTAPEASLLHRALTLMLPTQWPCGYERGVGTEAPS